MSFWSALFLLLVGLKLTGYIGLSWLVIVGIYLSPLALTLILMLTAGSLDGGSRR